MQYRKLGNTGLCPSALGFGMMRLPQKDGKTDGEASIQMLRWAIDNGLTYVDTAYNYLDGDSERITGQALQDGYREKVILATKAPVYLFEAEEDFDRILEEQLSRLQTDHIDCYLLHALSLDTWENRVLKYNVLEHMKKAKEAGKIRHLGFSFHDSLETFQTILNGFDAWEFCQIQLNYLDTAYQAGIAGLELAASRGLGVVIMEPLRGGLLADPPKKARKVLDGRSPVRMGLSFLWDRPEVSVVLSGMGSLQMAQENMKYASECGPGMLTEQEHEVLRQAAKEVRASTSVPCTGCNYCSVCPQGIAIPKAFAAYNKLLVSGDRRGEQPAYDALGDARPSNCVECHTCEERCPQHIEIAEMLKKVVRAFES